MRNGATRSGGETQMKHHLELPGIGWLKNIMADCFA
jgi:hypothetical protein